MVLIKFHWSSNDMIKSTVLITSWKRKTTRPQGARYSSTTIAFTRVNQKPNVTSPQSHPRDMGLYCGMTNDQLFDEGLFYVFEQCRRTQTIPNICPLQDYFGIARLIQKNDERTLTLVHIVLKSFKCRYNHKCQVLGSAYIDRVQRSPCVQHTTLL